MNDGAGIRLASFNSQRGRRFTPRDQQGKEQAIDFAGDGGQRIGEYGTGMLRDSALNEQANRLAYRKRCRTPITALRLAKKLTISPLLNALSVVSSAKQMKQH